MRRQDSIKKILKIQKDDGSDVSIENIPLRLEIRRGISVVKTMVNDEWIAHEEAFHFDGAKPLKTIDDGVSFLLIINNEEINAFEAGAYTIGAYYIENDADFIDGTRTRYAALNYTINIEETAAYIVEGGVVSVSDWDKGGSVSLAASNTHEKDLSLSISILVLSDDLILHDNLIL